MNYSVSIVSDMVQIELPMETLRLVAGCNSISTNANDIFKTLYNDLEDITIEMHDHERVDYLML